MKLAEMKTAARRAQSVAGQIMWAVLIAAGAKVDIEDFLPRDSDDGDIGEPDQPVKTTLDEINEDLEAKGLRGPYRETADTE